MDRDEVSSPGGFPLTHIRSSSGSVCRSGRVACVRRPVEGYWTARRNSVTGGWIGRCAPDVGFADAFQKEWLERYEPGKARFRTFVRVCADRFVMNTRQTAARLKRGGGVQVLSLDFDGAEREVAARRLGAPAEPDELFHQEFVRALFERAVEDLRAECEAQGRQLQFTLFERYDLNPSEGVSYADLARELGLTTTQVTNHLAHARRRFRERAVDALRGLCGSDEEFRREARDLFGLDPE